MPRPSNQGTHLGGTILVLGPCSSVLIYYSEHCSQTRRFEVAVMYLIIATIVPGPTKISNYFWLSLTACFDQHTFKLVAFHVLLARITLRTVLRCASSLDRTRGSCTVGTSRSLVALHASVDEVFPGRWMGRNRQVSWPPRLPERSAICFFFLGQLKKYCIRNQSPLT